MIRIKKIIRSGIVIFVPVLCIIFSQCSDPIRTQFDDTEDAITYHASVIKNAPAISDSLTVMTWNIRFGAGRIPLFYDGFGERYNMTKSEVVYNLTGLCNKITEIDPDILLLQEVDIESKRTAYVDELQFILDHTGLHYAVFAAIWKADFVPSDGIGRINYGNAILCKWPLINGERIALPIRTDQSSLEKYFWFHRNILKAVLPIPDKPSLTILNMHAEAFGKDGTKKKHIDRFKQELDKISLTGGYFVGGGDFNALPPGSPQVKDFPDIPITARFGPDDYSGEETWMDDMYAAYKPAIPLSAYHASPAPYYSYTADENGFWCRTLDYLFTNNALRSGKVLQSSVLPNGHTGVTTMPLSDHAPVYSVLGVKP
jgi:endonuclease/exonuclease/phosphatase family metal-dependent hydrolase